MRNNLNILILACFCIIGLLPNATAQQAVIRPIQASINNVSVNPIIYANSSVNIQSSTVNISSTVVPGGDVLALMVSVDGDAPTILNGATLPGDLIPFGTWPQPNTTQIPYIEIDRNNYTFSPARFSGGGGLVHDIIIWPTKIAGGNTTVITSDSIVLKALYIDAAGFRITNNTVLGLSGTLNLETVYPQINAIAENVGISANTRDLEFYIQLDNYAPKLLGSTSTSVAPGNQYGMVVPNFRIRDYYPNLAINSAFRYSTHLLQVFAREKNLVNTIGIAEFMVDASNSFPVELLGFDGYMDNHQVQLNWATTNERNNSHFFVQKYLPEQGVYENLGRVNGIGFSDTTNYYEITDTEPFVGVNTYRLVQVDFDGTAVLTGETLEVNYQLDNERMELVQAYPNPFNAATTLQLRLPESGDVKIEVFDTMGKRVWAQTNDAHAGMNEIYLDLADHRSGTYLYRVQLNGETLSGKLVKR